MLQDSHGFLWFGTPEGLSRFDGYSFTTYRKQNGLPGEYITDFLETRRGVYWVGTAGGLARFDPTGRGGARFQVVPLNGPHGAVIPEGLYEDPQGGVWCVGGQGTMFYQAPGDTVFRLLDLHVTEETVSALLEDQRGILWIGTPDGLFRRGPDGRAVRCDLPPGFSHAFIMGLLEDRHGILWVGTRDGLIRMESLASGLPGSRVFTARDGLPDNRVEQLLETADGTLWVATAKGLAERAPAAAKTGPEFQGYTMAQGLSDNHLSVLTEDHDGNLWIGTAGAGVMKVNRSGLISFTEADGIPKADAVMESRQGQLCAVYRAADGVRLAGFDGSGFRSVRPAWPAGITELGWGDSQIAVHDRAHEWWIATGGGLCRFGPMEGFGQLAGAHPISVLSTRDGLASDSIFKIFEDSRGDIWIGAMGPRNGLARWNRATGQLQAFSQADGLPPQAVPTSFAEDREGNLWMSLFNRSLVRYRKGCFTTFPAREVGGSLNTVYADATGRLWAGTFQGLVRIDNPAADRPRFVLFRSADGLSSHDILSIAEDHFGRLYAVTGRGVDRFEAQSDGLRHVKHYTTADGIPPGELKLAVADRQGSIWFGTSLGLARLTPAPDPARPPPPVLLTGLSAGGVPQPLSDLGESAITGLKLPPMPLRIDFSGLSFAPGEPLRYQYMLTGEDRDWSAPTDQRSVVYARLAAGSYRFLVRAVAGDGKVSPLPASLAFTIPPPLWRAWWFLAACAVAAASVIYGAHRYRLKQLLAVATVRMRIATDLHDDIGSSLSQIAILSEVAQTGAEPRNGAPLAEIAGISRELVDAMSDIVWAINPEHDHLSNLVYRMRRFAADLLGGLNIALNFHSLVTDHDLQVGVEVRRQVYLIFKETLHNVVRHSGARSVDVKLGRAGDTLILVVGDDGRGFDPGVKSHGHGLASMAARAAALGGSIEIESSPGRGTAVRIAAKLEKPRSLAVLTGKWKRRFR